MEGRFLPLKNVAFDYDLETEAWEHPENVPLAAWVVHKRIHREYDHRYQS